MEDNQTWNTLMQEGGIEAGLNDDMRFAADRIHKADNRWRHWPSHPQTSMQAMWCPLVSVRPLLAEFGTKEDDRLTVDS